MRDIVGKDFTLKQVQHGWRKASIEMSKRLDPQLPYYYHTSSHDRYYEGERPSFDVQSKPKSRVVRPRRRELVSTLMSGRASLPVAGSKSVRMQFHNLPVDVPPVPGTEAHISDHTINIVTLKNDLFCTGKTFYCSRPSSPLGNVDPSIKTRSTFAPTYQKFDPCKFH